MKTCIKCGEVKNLDEYYQHSGARDGLRRQCKVCVKAKQKEGHDPDKAKAVKLRYYERNRELAIRRSKEWRIANRERYNQSFREAKALDPEAAKIRARGYAIKRKYGLSLEQYDELLERQNGCCAICERHQSEFKTNLAVDHSHRSFRIRGLLCTACNYRLVARHEDPELLRKIADYLEQGTEWYAPEKKKRKKRGKRNQTPSASS